MMCIYVRGVPDLLWTIKVVEVVEDFDDCTNMRIDISRFDDWRSTDDLSINTDKCSPISLFRNRNFLVF